MCSFIFSKVKPNSGNSWENYTFSDLESTKAIRVEYYWIFKTLKTLIQSRVSTVLSSANALVGGGKEL